ncbi:hypothetical protein PFLmoz3_00623 [Pseudomonas fluorescens]|uniref:Uncharacterized protein n=1 Tax=Pseudomonas fluorescens TaxID=294 RepID=A0A109LLQ5_PSEFL|nr:hypothetical protein PFLmoz3_00623 [Pseudomonas fluorescens]
MVFIGTLVSASWDTAAIVGRIMMANTSAAGSNPGPLRDVPKNGIQPSSLFNQVVSGRMAGITT